MPTPPRPSSTVCCFRQRSAGSEVLMVQRSQSARFMAGAWVFPGGAVDEIDRTAEAIELLGGVEDPADRPWVLAAARELVEEVGIWLTTEPFSDPARLLDEEVFASARERGVRFDGTRLAYFANWITPALVPVRFEARFYAALVPPDVEAHPDSAEIAAARWIRPKDAIARGAGGEMLIPFPTMKTLDYLVGFETADDLFAHASGLERVDPIQPRMRVGPDGALEVVLPGEPGFDDIDESAEPDPDALLRAAQLSSEAGRATPEAGI